MSDLKHMLSAAGFSKIAIDIKERSREVVKQWIPGSGAEDYVINANISAFK